MISKLARILWDDQVERVACLLGKQDGDTYVVLDILPACNEDIRPADEFFISGKQMTHLADQAKRKGYQLLGVAHSHLPHHPSVPSEADVTYCRHAVNAVYHPATSTLTWFNAEGQISHQGVEAPWMLPVFRTAFAFA